MFIYTFTTKGKYLLSHIVITCSYLTLYFNKENPLEISFLAEDLHMRRIKFVEDPAHKLMHNPMVKFSSLGERAPHQHMKFNSEDRKKELTNIFLYLIEKQKDTKYRREFFHKICCDIENDRLRSGQKELPEEIQSAIDAYDFTIPFLPSQEVELLLKKFNKYLQSAGFAKKAEDIGNYSEKLLHTHGTFLYLKPWEDPETLQEKHLNALYKNLLDLRIEMLRLDAEKYSYSRNASKQLESILNTPYFLDFQNPDYLELVHLLKPIEKLISERNKENIYKTNLIFITLPALSVGLAEIYLYYRYNDVNASLFNTVFYSSLAGLVGYTANKTMSYVNQSIFSFFENKTRSKPPSVEPSIAILDEEALYMLGVADN